VNNHGKMRIALVGRTVADVRDVMVEGPSGILATASPQNMPVYMPGKRRIEWPNGAIATTYSAEEASQLRGPEHDAAWCDELAAWRDMEMPWHNLMMGLRLGRNPQVVVTTTPQPRPLLKRLIKASTTAITTGTTYENLDNLASAFAEEIIGQYEGTRLGRQELHAELLEDNPDALWKRAQLDALRYLELPQGISLVRVVVAVDPAATSGEGSDETGIIVAALGSDGHAYILDDKSVRATPHLWASEAVAAFDLYGADRIVAEANNGGEMVEHTLRTVEPNIPYRSVHASRGKIARAEPVASLYEQGLVHHIGFLKELEDQQCNFTGAPGQKSPDRMDALVWALTDLLIGKHGRRPGTAVPMAATRFNRPEWQRRVEEAEEQYQQVVATGAHRAEDDEAVRAAERAAQLAGILRDLNQRAPFLGLR
jgi:phage terminase large subunit-like protein